MAVNTAPAAARQAPAVRNTVPASSEGETDMNTAPATTIPMQSPNRAEQTDDNPVAMALSVLVLSMLQCSGLAMTKSRTPSSLFTGRPRIAIIGRLGKGVSMLRTTIAAAALFACARAAMADGSGIVSEMAEKALARGYGATCSLEMKPVASGGYYPCLDFGPYRYVRGYGKVYGLVVQKGREPFLVMSGAPDAPSFIYDGPWQVDMPSRIVMWWNDTVEGMAAKADAQASASAEKKAAEDYISSLNGGGAKADKPKEEAAQPASPPTEEISPDIKDILTAK